MALHRDVMLTYILGEYSHAGFAEYWRWVTPRAHYIDEDYGMIAPSYAATPLLHHSGGQRASPYDAHRNAEVYSVKYTAVLYMYSTCRLYFRSILLACTCNMCEYSRPTGMRHVNIHWRHIDLYM